MDKFLRNNHLNYSRTRPLPRLNHHLPRLEHNVLVLQRRHLAIHPQTAQWHASLAAVRAPQLRQVVPAALVPTPRVVDQLDKALEADGHVDVELASILKGIYYIFFMFRYE